MCLSMCALERTRVWWCLCLCECERVCIMYLKLAGQYEACKLCMYRVEVSSTHPIPFGRHKAREKINHRSTHKSLQSYMI